MTKKELLKQMREVIIDGIKDYEFVGLCHAYEKVTKTVDSVCTSSMLKDIPELHRYKDSSGSGYWWPRNQSGMYDRLKVLDELIYGRIDVIIDFDSSVTIGTNDDMTNLMAPRVDGNYAFKSVYLSRYRDGCRIDWRIEEDSQGQLVLIPKTSPVSGSKA